MRNFGQSVGFHAPGLFIDMLTRKADGAVIEFNTRRTALSQTCRCGQKKKKSLKERWHQCHACDVRSQRDLYSAFVDDNQLDTSQASADILLEQTVSSLNKTAISKAHLASFGLGLSQSGLSAKKESMHYEALDVVT